jgi:hypothetical protein
MISRELAHLAGEARGAVGEENLDLGEAAGIEEELARAGIAVRVFRPEVELELPAERDPRRLAAPARLHERPLERREPAEGSEGPRRRVLLEPPSECRFAASIVSTGEA